MSELNLCEILKGYEGAVFYSRSLGSVTLVRVNIDELYFTSNSEIRNELLVDQYGYVSEYGEQDVFPTKDLRDWERWVKELRNKIPKTWGELIEYNEILLMGRATSNPMYAETDSGTAIEKAASALLKIHQLIEVGYGGNVSRESWNDEGYGAWCVLYNYKTRKFEIQHSVSLMQLIAFQTLKQAEEFLLYTENVQLLKDFYMV